MKVSGVLLGVLSIESVDGVGESIDDILGVVGCALWFRIEDGGE